MQPFSFPNLGPDAATVRHLTAQCVDSEHIGDRTPRRNKKIDLTFTRSRRRASQPRPGAVASPVSSPSGVVQPPASSASARPGREAQGKLRRRRACFLSVPFLCTSKEREPAAARRAASKTGRRSRHKTSGFRIALACASLSGMTATVRKRTLRPNDPTLTLSRRERKMEASRRGAAPARIAGGDSVTQAPRRLSAHSTCSLTNADG